MTQSVPQPVAIAISGTYSTGKTTTTEALSLATGIPTIQARSAREILFDLTPEKSFQHLDARELLALGLRRLEERIHGEALAASNGCFLSDGSVLNEWVYGRVRMIVGLNPGAPLLERVLRRIAGFGARRFMERYLDAYGTVVKERAKRLYTCFVHLPVEFPMDPDGHRPVSERYRTLSDTLLLDTVNELGLPCAVVRGTLSERIAAIVDHYRLPLAMPIEDAVRLARERIGASRDALHERWLATREQPSIVRRMRYASRY